MGARHADIYPKKCPIKAHRAAGCRSEYPAPTPSPSIHHDRERLAVVRVGPVTVVLVEDVVEVVTASDVEVDDPIVADSVVVEDCVPDAGVNESIALTVGVDTEA